MMCVNYYQKFYYVEILSFIFEFCFDVGCFFCFVGCGENGSDNCGVLI